MRYIVQMIREFFSNRNHWSTLLEYCCFLLGVKLSLKHALLGCGASGRVFNVQDNTGVQYAMKLVYSSDTTIIATVQAEILTLQSIKAAGGNTVNVVENKTANYRNPSSNTITGVSYLMAETGTTITAEGCMRNTAVAGEVFMALCKLHMIRCYHGDARLPNLIRYRGVLLWIDFMRINLAYPSTVDISTFVLHDGM